METLSFAFALRLVPSKGIGANAARIYMILVGGIGLYYPLYSGKTKLLYGEWTDPSPKEQREGKNHML